MENITAVVDAELVKQKANEFATKGALAALENYYTGYDSPFKRAIVESLQENRVDAHSLSLPDIIGLINTHLGKEIDIIANTAVAKTFVPLVAKFLTRQEKFANFSDILKGFIESAAYGTASSDFEVSVNKDRQYGWLNISINDDKRNYEFTLHEDSESKKTGNIKYLLLGLPYERGIRVPHTMKVNTENFSIEMPFTRDILADKFTSHLAGYILSRTIITIDMEDFDDELFPSHCHCH